MIVELKYNLNYTKGEKLMFDFSKYVKAKELGILFVKVVLILFILFISFLALII